MVESVNSQEFWAFNNVFVGIKDLNLNLKTLKYIFNSDNCLVSLKGMSVAIALHYFLVHRDLAKETAIQI